MLKLLSQCLQDGTISDAALRLARQVPDLQPGLADLPLDPIQRALAGVAPVSVEAQVGLANRVRAGIAAQASGTLTAKTAAMLEKEATDDLTWWVPAARLHALTDPARERAGRMMLSDQNLPYVFPGELHPVQIDLFAVGDVVLPALHVDWVRKLTGLAAQAIEQDCGVVGLWSRQLLGVLEERTVVREIQRVRRNRRIPPGGRGLAAIYLDELGHDATRMMAGTTPGDTLVRELARLARQARR